MARDQDRLEALADGFTAFHTTSGERWKHIDMEVSRVGAGYRLFVADSGEQRRYDFGPTEPHDATLFDLREQVRRATPMTPTDADESSSRHSP